MTSLMVSEIFGPTFQGEGPSAGRRAWFLRLGGCNLACSWCDTPYTWDARRFDLRAEIIRTPIADLPDQLGPCDDLLVITGGEPLLQTRGVGQLLAVLGERPVEVETNGTLAPPLWPRPVDFNVSPKLTNSGRATALHPAWLDVATARFKFVVTSAGDITEAAALGTPRERTWVMPEGTTSFAVLGTAQKVADAAARYGFNLTLRQHVLLWGSERGR